MLSEESHTPATLHLTVLPSSDKVEQIRREVVPAAAADPAPVAVQSSAMANKLLEAKVITAISKVYDPEIPVNVYDLGLIYEIAIAEDNSVKVKMTLTAPGCPVAGSLPVQVEQQIEAIPEVASAEVELVWDPPWTKARMSEAAQLELGFL